MLINASWQKTIEGIFESGRCLNEAKRELDPDDYNAMLAQDLLMSPSTASKLRTIAKHPTLFSHVKKLPPYYATIYELTDISPERLEILIEEGKINPDMERWQAGLVAEAEAGEEQYRPNRRVARRPATEAVAADDSDDDFADSDNTTETEADETEADDDDEDQIVNLADDIGKAFAETLARTRRKIDYVRQHGDRIARELLADQLREVAEKIMRLADGVGDPQ